MVFLLFLAVLVLCVAFNWSIIWALAAGLVLFFGKACKQGFHPGSVWKMAWSGMMKTRTVIWMFLFIGMVTGVWRACGTIPWIVSVSAQAVSPQFFVLSAFLLSALMSILTGTSLGTVSTMGTVLMIIASANGANAGITAGAVISGAYVGDRASPMSSCARLMGECVGNDYYDNIGIWVKTAILPVAVCCVAYGVCRTGTQGGQAQVLGLLQKQFVMHPSLVLPAVLILVLSVAKVPVRLTMALSAGLAFVLGILVQKLSVWQLFSSMLVGYHLQADNPLAGMINGGGITSMLRAGFIVLFSGAYAGIFEGTGMMDWAKDFTTKASCRMGVFPVTLAFSILLCAVSCNQSLALMLTSQLCGHNYADPKDQAADLANTSCLIPGLIPWSIASAIPLSVLGVQASCLVFAVYLWGSPLCHLLWRLHRPVKMPQAEKLT